MNKNTLNSLEQLLTYLEQNAKTKGIEFERCCKWFLENDPEYKQQLQKIWSWNDWPGSNGKRDTGIDLIAQDRGGLIWAIQVKAYDESYYITKSDIDSFLSASNRSDISFRLLIATTNKIGSISRDTFADQEKPVSLCLRDKLEISPVDWMLSLSDTKFVQKDIKKPRQHQQEALDAIIKGFEIIPSKGQVHMACGTGKSLLGLWLAQKFQAQYTLVLVPSISLVGQLRRTWAENSGNFIFDSIFVCSDQTVGYKHSDERQEAFEMGFPATTNAQELVQQLLSNSRPKVIFSTYHSSIVIEESCKLKPDLTFDLVIADEAHRCVGKVKNDFAIITDDNKIRAHRKLYMTATPRFFTERVKKKTQEYECEIASMDDEGKFGPVLYRLPFSEAIQKNLLTDYQVIISVIDHTTYREYAEKGTFINIDDYETDARKIATQLLIVQAIQKYGLKKIISFHNGVAVAQDFIQTIPKAVGLLPQDERPQIDYCNVVYGEQSQSERYKILKNFNNPDFTGAVIIGNDRCLREGVDIPALDAIVFADPKNSEVDIIQAVGRAIRLSSDKKIGTIIIPVFVDKQSEGVEDLENSCFKKVWQIIKALRVHDDVLAEELDNIRLELGKRSYKAPAKLPSKIVTDVSVKIDVNFARLIEGKIVESVIEKCTDGWDERFGELIRFKEEYAHCNVPQEYSQNKDLGSWVSVQRSAYKIKKISLDRIKKLESIGFKWNQNHNKWEEMFFQLCDYHKKNGDCLVPRDFCENIALATWVADQRKMYNKNRLSQERIAKLELMGFCWDPLDKSWDARFDELCAYREKYGDDAAPSKSSDHHNLSIWMQHQRIYYREGRLSVERITRLESIGFDWDPLNNRWHERFTELQQYKEIHGDFDVPLEYPESPLLKTWLHNQRTYYKKNKISLARVKLLNSIDFIWDPLQEQWMKMFNQLCMYQLKESHCDVPKRYDKNQQLGLWCQSQRNAYKNEKLSQDRIKKLEEVGFTWDPMEEQWNQMFIELCKYREINGTCNVPNRYKINRTLALWVLVQRKVYRDETMLFHRKAQLESIGFDWDPVTTAWEIKLFELCKYREIYGDCNVSSKLNKYLALWRWTHYQRTYYKKGGLTLDQISRLNEIGFMWKMRP